VARRKKKRQKIIGLQSAEILEERPTFIPPACKISKAQRAGLLYEKRVAEYFRALYDEVVHGAWIKYDDRYGSGYCQPDIIIAKPSAPLVVVECKLTATKGAYKQLRDMYLPVVAKIYGVDKKKIKLVQICKNLTERFAKEPMIDTLDEMFEEDRRQVVTLQLRSVPFL
jgi:hypothetical protein